MRVALTGWNDGGFGGVWVGERSSGGSEIYRMVRIQFLRNGLLKGDWVLRD
jgi:hypothetical protein